MSAFPQLGYGFKSNTSHITEDILPTDEVFTWWDCISDDTKIELIVKQHPDCLKQSDLMRIALWNLYCKNPQKLFDKFFEEK